MGTLLLAACASRIPATLASEACVSEPLFHWPMSGGEQSRVVRVWLDASPGAHDGWPEKAQPRLRHALSMWNELSLPVQLVPATSRHEAEIQVNVITRFPVDSSGGRSGYQAGLTRVLHNDAGEILRASVIVAVATPWGARYSTADQEATLLHELGHALGLPHSRSPFALMAREAGTTALTEITSADAQLARAAYAARSCGAGRVVARAAPGR